MTEQEKDASEELRRLLMDLRINPGGARGSSQVMEEIQEICQEIDRERKKQEENDQKKKDRDHEGGKVMIDPTANEEETETKERPKRRQTS